MKMKKILAAVSALTIVGANLGLAVFAEEAAVITEDSAVITEETVFTEPVIAEETAEETTEKATEETEVTADETTVKAEEVTEDSTIVKDIIDATVSKDLPRESSFTIDGISFVAKLIHDQLNESEGFPRYISIYYSNGDETNIMNVLVAAPGAGGTPDTEAYYNNVNSFFSFENDTITIHSDISGDTSYEFDIETNSFVEAGSSPEDDTPEVTEEMLYDKFVSEYGEPDSFEFGDFNNDGKPDAFAYVFGSELVCYFVTADGISKVSSDIISADSLLDYSYFHLGNDVFRVRSYAGGGARYFHHTIAIYKINKDGTLTPCTINGKEDVEVCYDEYYKGIDHDSALTADQIREISTFIKSNGDYLTITVYDFEKGIIGASTNYVFDSASNNFVVGKTLNGGSQGGSAGSSGTVTNSPATSDSMSVPAVAASAIVVMGSVIYVSKKRK